MSLATLLRCLQTPQFSKKEQEWFPKWLAGYIQHHRQCSRTEVQLDWPENITVPQSPSLKSKQACTSSGAHLLQLELVIHRIGRCSIVNDRIARDSDALHRRIG